MMAVACLSSFAVAGGDLAPVEPVVDVPVVEESAGAFYVGLSVSAVSTRDGSMNFFDVEPGQDRTGNLGLLAGYEFNPYIAVEGRYSMYIAEEDVVNSDIWGVYLKPQYPVTEAFNVYALVGFGGVTVEGVNGHTIDADDTGFQWGLGASYDMTDNIAVFVDYINVANGMDATGFEIGGVRGTEIDSDTITLGVTYKF